MDLAKPLMLAVRLLGLNFACFRSLMGMRRVVAIAWDLLGQTWKSGSQSGSREKRRRNAVPFAGASVHSTAPSEVLRRRIQVQFPASTAPAGSRDVATLLANRGGRIRTSDLKVMSLAS